MKPSKIPKILLVGLALILFCSSCVSVLSTETELKIGENEKWSLEMIFVLDGQDPIMTSQFKTALGDGISQAQQMGIEAEWKQLSNQSNSSNATYQIKLSGTGYDALNETVFDGQQAVSEGLSDNQVGFMFNPSDSFLRSGEQNSFTLIAGKILSANGSITNNRTVVWTDPSSTMVAIVTPMTNLTLSLPIMVLLSVSILGIVGTFILLPVMKKRSKQKQLNLVDLSRPTVQYCINCGKQVPSQAEFCPFCGERTS